MAELLCELGLPRSSYFYHRARLQVVDKYAEARQVMADIFERNYRCYGYRRMRASLTDQSVSISEKVVRRLMKQECLVAATSKRRRYGSYLGEISPAPENVLNRDFSAGAPNEKWLTDITEFQIPAGKVYLSPMIDCFDGMVVSQRLAALVPRPRLHLIRYHGVLAPNARLRPLVVPQKPEVQERAAEVAVAGGCDVQTVQSRPHRVSWARLLKRVFDIDVERCPNCGAGELKIIAAILERPVIEKILSHLGLDPQPPPKGRAREAGLHFVA